MQALTQARLLGHSVVRPPRHIRAANCVLAPADGGCVQLKLAAGQRAHNLCYSIVCG